MKYYHIVIISEFKDGQRIRNHYLIKCSKAILESAVREIAQTRNQNSTYSWEIIYEFDHAIEK